MLARKIMMVASLLSTLMLVPLSGLSGAETAKNHDNFLLSRHKAGNLAIGMTIDALYAVYDRNLTKMVDLYYEGMFTPALEIYVKGEKRPKPSLIAEIAWHRNWVVDRILVQDPRFKTDKGMGVGSTLGEIMKNYRVDSLDFGEGDLCAVVKEVDLTFVLEPFQVPEEWYKTRSQNLIPDSVKVASVIIWH